jgi:hypothetical protein
MTTRVLEVGCLTAIHGTQTQNELVPLYTAKAFTLPPWTVTLITVEAEQQYPFLVGVVEAKLIDEESPLLLSRVALSAEERNTPPSIKVMAINCAEREYHLKTHQQIAELVQWSSNEARVSAIEYEVERAPSQNGIFEVAVQTDEDMLFPREQLRVPVHPDALSEDASYTAEEKDHPDF